MYLVGPSGAGKDTLLAAIAGDPVLSERMRIAKRYITRPVTTGGEQHRPLTVAEYQTMLSQNQFALAWTAHKTHYGIDRSIDQWLADGLAVMVNGSRAYLAEAQQRYAGLLPIWLTVRPELLRDRLRSRGRESEQQIEQRVQRNLQLEQQRPMDCRLLDNSGSIDQTVATMRQWLHEDLV